jgi:hypothetical protein
MRQGKTPHIFDPDEDEEFEDPAGKKGATYTGKPYNNDYVAPRAGTWIETRYPRGSMSSMGDPPAEIAVEAVNL